VTSRGLAIGAPVDQLISLYPEAKQGGGGAWWLATGFSLIGDCDEPPPGCECPILSASANSGFVEKFEIVIGAGGE